MSKSKRYLYSVLLPLRSWLQRQADDREDCNPTVRTRRFVFKSGLIVEAFWRRSGKFVAKLMYPDGRQVFIDRGPDMPAIADTNQETASPAGDTRIAKPLLIDVAYATKRWDRSDTWFRLRVGFDDEPIQQQNTRGVSKLFLLTDCEKLMAKLGIQERKPPVAP